MKLSLIENSHAFMREAVLYAFRRKTTLKSGSLPS